jgi:hypothetical protein
MNGLLIHRELMPKGEVFQSARCDLGFAPWVRQLTLINEPREALTSKAAQVGPQPPIVEAGLAAVQCECTLPRQDGTDRFVVS